MKQCPKCRTDNPDDANFCRRCRYDFGVPGSGPTTVGRTGFTPSLFPGIKLQPRSVYNISFFSIKTLLIKIFLLVVWIVFFDCFLGELVIDNFNYEECSVYDSYIEPSLFFLTLFLLVILIIRYCRIFYRIFSFKRNAKYVEQNNFMSGVSRVAKNGKLGLFDTNRKVVLLPSKYDNISVFDTDHLLIEIGLHRGVYSLKKHSIIIPVCFDRIDNFNNSMAAAYCGCEVCHFDVNGNKMN